ncbi:MAG: intradiol ring-cleavage dioxygenase, partial [Winogradskyella sp.]|nr:intradiol ring-cleavage dioxygenase [Winogradskyella sp.]NNL83898.1 intradiol ring-cleavage dioxygenase [Winogradskyella sp.]
TDKDGKYTIFTFRPGSYPNRLEPEHIHITVKEPNTNAYYIDDFVFDDDPLLTPQRRQQLRNRCGSGISKPQLKDGILTTERDLILGLNIPDYE